MPSHDLVVIGAGPGGYVAAIRAAQLGLNVGIVEREAALGGTCLRVGCIPSKALLESSEKFHEASHEMAAHGVQVSGATLDLATMLKRKDDIVSSFTQGVAALMKKNKITVYSGVAKFTGPRELAVSGGNPTQLSAKHVIIATGSKPSALAGVAVDGGLIGTSTEGLAFPEVPKRLVVIGAGYIGLELGSVWQRLGAKVTVLEYLERILPGTDSEIAAAAQRLFERQGIEFRLKARVKGARVDKSKDGACLVEIEGAEPIRCDRVLLAAGRSPNTDGLDAEKIGVKFDQRRRIEVDDAWQTSVPGVYAIGDVVRGPMLAHKAMDEGAACVERIVTGHGEVNYDAIPGIVYTQPEVATVGKSEDELKQAGRSYRKGVFSFKANGRARALNQTDGRVKILADAATDRVLGVHILGARAGDLIAEVVAAIRFGASSEDIALCSHAHPTLAEVVKEAALAVDGRAVHG